MKIRIDAADIYHDMMPAGHDDGLMYLDLPDGTTPIGALKRLGFPTEGQAYLLIVNDSTVPKSQQDILALNDGDELSILMPLKGG